MKTCIYCVKNHSRSKSKFCSSKCYFVNYWLNNRDKLIHQVRTHREKPEVKNQRRLYGKEYYLRPEVKKRVLKYLKEYCKRPDVIEAARIRRRKWYLKNRKWYADYNCNKRQINLNYKILQNLRRRLHHALKRTAKQESLSDLLGCTIEELKIHLQGQFMGGMNWENYGKWHIDHKIPCANFDLTKEKQRRECFHYSNLQPLWAKENRLKGSKLSN